MLKAIFFDFDGVLADTEPLHFEMFKQVLKDEGVTLSRHDYYEKYVGLDDRGCFEAVLSEHGRPAAPAVIGRMVERKSSLLLRQLQAARVVYPGIVEFVIAAFPEHLREIFRLRKAFEQITAAQDVRRGKPDPEGYLHGLQQLNRRTAIAASDCLVIEDTVAGIQAAHAAGMRCLAIANTFPAEQLSAADAVTPTLKEYDLTALAHRLWT